MKKATLALLLLLGCSRHSSTADPAANATATAAVETPGPGGGPRAERGAFGAHCRTDTDCSAGGVCFHHKPKNAEQGQGQGQGQAQPLHGFCSIACSSDADCPTPPTSGRCAEKKKMCRRHGGPGGQGQQGGQGGQTPAPTPSGGTTDQQEEE